MGRTLPGIPLENHLAGSGSERLQAALADRYRLGRELGRGGMATVFGADDLRHDREVAIKVLHPELATTLGPERFLREIRITAQLQHPHILPVLDSGDQAGVLWYAMPWVQGETLRARIAREKQLSIDDAVRIARQVASALGHAHGRGIVHRDIKPENILLDGDQAIVADFGIARALTAAGAEKLTATGLSIGTPTYMSPEQAAGGRDVDARSDIYSLACVLYEMLAGQPPFTAPTSQGILARHAIDPVPSLRTVRRTVPTNVERAITRALAKVPADRYASADQFADALSLDESSAPAFSERPGGRRRWLLPAAAAAAVGMALVALWPRLSAGRSHIVPSGAAIAVLPFVPSGPDTGLVRLGRDLVLTLSATLDGVGGIHAVDAHTVLAQRSAPFATADQDLALGRSLGASSVLRGSLLREGPNVRLDLALVAGDSVAPIARVAVTAPADSIGALTNAVTWSLLPQIWRRGTPPSPNLDGALRTRSVPALRAFLEGERAFVDNRWDDATDAYSRAIGADSSFWLAYSRYAYVLGWRNKEMDSTLGSRLDTHLDSLPDKERLLLDPPDDSSSAAIARARELTERYPDNWFGWMLYGDRLFHYGGLLGHTGAETRSALEQTLRLNPQFIPGWEHLLMLVLLQHDTVATTRALQALGRLDAAPAFQLEWGTDRLLQFRLVDRVQRGDSTGARILADSVRRDVARAHAESFESPGVYGLYGPDIALQRAILREPLPPAVARTHRVRIALDWAARGAWDSSLAALDEHIRLDAEIDTTAAIRAYRVGVLGAWLGAVPAAAAASRRAAAEQAARVLGPGRVDEIAWLDGLLAMARLDRPGLAKARQALRASGDSADALELDRSLGAFELALTGATREAGESLAALESRSAEHWNFGWWNHPAMMPVDRLAAAQWLLAAGDTARAAHLLTWVDSEIATRSVNPLLHGLVELTRGRIEEARGHADLAREHYEGFLRRYDLPVPAHRDLRLEATRALNRLTNDGDTP